MLFFVLTSGRCNLQCRYCGGSFPEDRVPYDVTYDLESLKDFIEKDPDAIITFYGGEPLINAKFIEKVLEHVKAKHFVIQTNGLLYERLDRRYWNKMDAVLLSIDGRKEVTDFYRGNNVYEKVIEAARHLKSAGFKGDLIARMAVSEHTDIYEDVLHLISLGLFDHIHWQLDVGWSTLWHDFIGWCRMRYMPGIKALVNFWRNELQSGRVIGLVPFLGILKRLRNEVGETPPCGAGEDAFAIMPNGDVLACPIAFDVEWSRVGNIYSNTPSNLSKVKVSDSCKTCKYFRICGGRCLYINKERLWNKENMDMVCEITKFTIDEVLNCLNIVENLLEKQIINSDDLDYPKFNNSTEIIP
ncbi:MAG: TIGR04084 family radical SAM/SPASM domain-containing protein [Candidatus Methanomethyliales bacterium]|nr:TIGR04084 family radical SAM/SPASM domain-containing protein [Candidatus Methanomethylicales archaeon]